MSRAEYITRVHKDIEEKAGATLDDPESPKDLIETWRKNIFTFASAIDDRDLLKWTEQVLEDFPAAILLADAHVRTLGIDGRHQAVLLYYYGLKPELKGERKTDKKIAEEILSRPRSTVTGWRLYGLREITRKVKQEREDRERQANYDTWNTLQF